MLGIAEDVKIVLRNQENFNLRLVAIERNDGQGKTVPANINIKLPLDNAEDMVELEELLESQPAAREQLVIITKCKIFRSYTKLYFKLVR